ncbi:ribonuclease E [Streptacidiphilus sp. MAP12-16]|uniref:Rne/Rng family ribonuclease n=1 Tax=Streptacidiphilus sp. MAP12-16 TaxID=3156300 RepID=UPI003517D123
MNGRTARMLDINDQNEPNDQNNPQGAESGAAAEGSAPKAAPRRRRAASRPAGPPQAEGDASGTPVEGAADSAAEAPAPAKRVRRTRKKAEPELAAETPATETPATETQAELPSEAPAEAPAAAEPVKRARRTRKKAEPVQTEIAVPEQPAPVAVAAPAVEEPLVEEEPEEGPAPAPAPVAAAPAAEEAAAPRSRRRAVRPSTAVFQAPVFQEPAEIVVPARPAVPAAAFTQPTAPAPDVADRGEPAEDPRRRNRRRATAPTAAPVVESAPAETEAADEDTTGRRASRRTSAAGTSARASAPAAPTAPAVFQQSSGRAPLPAADRPERAVERAEDTFEPVEDDSPAARRRNRRRAVSQAPTFEAPQPRFVEEAETSAEPEELDEETTEAPDSFAADEEGRPSRRRRRGGRRRRRGEGDDYDAPAAEQQTGQVDEEQDEEDEEEDLSEALSASSRRRRRRRRRSGEGGPAEVEAVSNGDDPERTVVKVREPRRRTAAAASVVADAPFDPDEVQSIKGSTRLEAKKQRRREGREQGRRRVPIITEAEFLARREAVERVMVVRQLGERTQIGVLEDNVLVEHYVNKEQATSYVGNVYLGKVQNVLPSMEAAFIDIGKGRNAVLYAGEVNFGALGVKGGPRRIESVLKSGQSVLVQVSKDPIGHKGARLTSQISLPGRYLVYVPEGSMTGISRKLPDTERARLKNILKKIVPDDAGVIVRTAAEGASEEELTRDVQRLQQQWEDIQKKVSSGNAPTLLYGEPDMTVRVVRDIFNEDFTKVIVSGDTAWETIHEYVAGVAPDLVPRLSRWTSEVDVFAAYRIDEQLMKALDRKVWLPSGGSLVIDKTEAMIVVDVNTGKFTGQGGNLEETVTRNNIEAAEEIVRQLRLRDLGGIIVIDFIDMVLESNRDLVLRRLLECLGRDRTKHQVAEVTSLGLVQMTRKRVGQGLLESFSETCVHCNGRGVIVHMEQAPPVPKGFTGPMHLEGAEAHEVSAEQGAPSGSESGGSKRRRRGRGGDAAAEAQAHDRDANLNEIAQELVTHGLTAEDVDDLEIVTSGAELEAEPVAEAAAAIAAVPPAPLDTAVQAEAEELAEAMIESSARPARTRRRAVRKATSPAGPPAAQEAAVVVVPTRAAEEPMAEVVESVEVAEVAEVVESVEPEVGIVAAAEPVAEAEVEVVTEVEAPAEAEVEPLEEAPAPRKRAPRKAAAKKAPAEKAPAKKAAAKKTATKKAAVKKTATKRAAKKAPSGDVPDAPAAE